jgi:sugar phosphate isomerase/epimerase
VLIGAMNHPEKEILSEIEWMAGLGLGFLDLTLEPPRAAHWRMDPASIRRALSRHGMDVVGHTAFYLPLANAFERIRAGAVEELRGCLDFFSEVGAKWMNIHPDRHTPWHGRDFYIEQNLRSLGELLPHARKRGIGLMIENLPGTFNSAAQLGELLDRMPELGLHLDVGHANLEVPHNTTEEILRAYGSRLRHVHLHDNKGGYGDLHMPLGSGSVDLEAAVRALRDCGYDGTITLEVFTPDRGLFEYSRDKLRQVWSATAERIPAGVGYKPSQN